MFYVFIKCKMCVDHIYTHTYTLTVDLLLLLKEDSS